jgi:hypothetical protein
MIETKSHRSQEYETIEKEGNPELIKRELNKRKKREIWLKRKETKFH